jgi:hypothetical protein
MSLGGLGSYKIIYILGRNSPILAQGASRSNHAESDDRRCGARFRKTIEDQQLMLDEHRLSDYGTNATRPRESSKSNHDLNEKDDKITHLGIVSKPSKCQESGPIYNSPGTRSCLAQYRSQRSGGLISLISETESPLDQNDCVFTNSGGRWNLKSRTMRISSAL